MSSVVISGNTSGAITLSAPDVAGTNTITLPASTGYLFVTPTAGTLSVDAGGTGITTTTAYGVLAGGTTATGAFQNLGTGTATQVLTSNGPGVLPSWQAAAGGQIQTQVFTSPGTWTKPSTVTSVKVTVVGGGGGGAAFTNAQTGGNGGYAIVSNVPVSGPVAVTVGSGGNGGTFPSAGSSGGSSSFGASVSVTGGAGAPTGAPGANGTSTISAGTTIRGVPSGPINYGAPAIISTVSGAYLSASGPAPSPSRFAVAYSETGLYAAGANGSGTNSGSGSSSAGVGGVVIVEWIG